MTEPPRLAMRLRMVGRRTRLGLAAAAGMAAAVGQAPFSLWPATLLGFAAAALLLGQERGARGAAAMGWAVGAGYFTIALHWIVEPFLVDAARHGWMAPFALLLFAAGLAFFWSAAFAAAAWLAPPATRPLALAVTLTVGEWARSVLLTGFPWALPAYAWAETPVVHAAALVGPHGLTLLTLVAACGTAAALMRNRPSLPALAAVVPLAAIAGTGWWMAQAPLLDGEHDPVVRLVQPNAPQNQKWDPTRAEAFLTRQLDFTSRSPAVDLVVWPETAIPWILNEARPVLDRISAAAGAVPVVLGAVRVEGGRAYNSLVVLGPDGAVLDIYDKHHLVPFGEYIPLGQLARLIGLRSFAAHDGYGYSAGPGPRRIDLGTIGRPLPLICYEAIFPDEVGAGTRPDWLLQITNDAWFGTFSGPYQHLAQARMRTVEQGLPMVRVANTGVSAVIDARGRIIAALPLGQAGYLDVALPPAAPPTLYARTGDIALLLLLAGALLVLRHRRMRVDRSRARG